MKKDGAGDVVEHLILAAIYWFLFVLPATPIIGLIRYLRPPDVIQFPVLALILVWYVCAAWLANKAAASRVAGARFGEAMGDGLSEGRAILSFLPIVGRYFGPPSDSPDRCDRCQQASRHK